MANHTLGQTTFFPDRAFDFERFILELKSHPGYRGQITFAARLPEREPKYGDPSPPLHPQLSHALATHGVLRLFVHQVEALERARRGENVVVVTGTASGKTLAYNLPVLEALQADSRATALYLFPTKALAQDQLKGLVRLLEPVPEMLSSASPAVYDGDTSQSVRRKIREQARIVLSNPDMLHRAVLPYHGRWSRFLENLRFVIVDEIHAYRGVFGSNVANVLRRLLRLANHHGSRPQFLSTSATIKNPVELAQALTGVPTGLIADDGSPRGAKWFVGWNPPFVDQTGVERRSSSVEAMELLVRLVDGGVQTIVFTRARVVAELVCKYAREELEKRDFGKAARLAPYRSGYLPSERRAIEKRLFSGELLGVVSTNALELGIDIGSLDASILVGFPGTVASTWQQAGRAGRGLNPSLTVLVGYDEPIDQYLLRNPDYLLGASPEAAVIDPENPYILAGHLTCAAFELPLGPEDIDPFGSLAAEVTTALSKEGRLLSHDEGKYWTAEDFPARSVDLRTISADTYSIVDATKNSAVIGNVDAISAPELIYPEAIYLHEGETYFVKKLDMSQKVAYVEPIAVDYYTQPVLDTSITIGRLSRQSRRGRECLTLTEATVTWATTQFKKIRFGTTDSLGYKTLNLPPQHLETMALGWSPSKDVKAKVSALDFHSPEGLWGVRNLLISVLPLFAMCDRADIGGVIDSSQRGVRTLFLYDRFPGGLGFCERAFEAWPDLIHEALKLVSDCPCSTGCPSCVGLPVLRPAQHQDPDVMGGYPIPNKQASRVLLEALAHFEFEPS